MDYSQVQEDLLNVLKVVNCFQFFKFMDYSQEAGVNWRLKRSCELLSVL